MAKPLSEASERVLRSLPLASQEINPGVRGKLIQLGYAEIVRLPSPYKKHKGANIDHYDVTEKGRRFLESGI